MGRMKLARQAADLARSAMAKMEAGVETPQTLNGPGRAWSAEEGGSGGDTAAAWGVQSDRGPTQVRGLTKGTGTAGKQGPGGKPEVSYTLRQLVRLSGKGEERVGEEDALAAEARRGLPAGGADRPSEPAPKEKKP